MSGQMFRNGISAKPYDAEKRRISKELRQRHKHEVGEPICPKSMGDNKAIGNLLWTTRN